MFPGNNMVGKCPYIAISRLSELIRFDSVRDYFVSLYCEGDFSKCERKKLRDEGEEVPEKLLPDGQFM